MEGALAKYQAGNLEAADFPGHDVRVKISIEKQRGYPDQNRIDDKRANQDHSFKQELANYFFSARLASLTSR